MSQLAWEVEKKVECLPFPNNLRGREIWYFLEFMFKPKVHVIVLLYDSGAWFTGYPGTHEWLSLHRPRGRSPSGLCKLKPRVCTP